MSIDLHSLHTIAFDFDGVFTDNSVFVDRRGHEFVRCNRGDGLGLQMLSNFIERRSFDIEIFVVSMELDSAVRARAKKLKIGCSSGVSDKLTFFERYFQERFSCATSSFSGLLYFGNDVNDLAVMRAAGYSVAPSDAHETVKSVATYVMPQKGGDQFVRAFIDQHLLQIQNLTQRDLNELIFNR